MCLKKAVCRCPFPHVLINLLLKESNVCSFSNLSEHDSIIKTEYIKYPNLYSISKTLLWQAIRACLLKLVSGCAERTSDIQLSLLTIPVALRLNFEVSISTQMHFLYSANGRHRKTVYPQVKRDEGRQLIEPLKTTAQTNKF